MKQEKTKFKTFKETQRTRKWQTKDIKSQRKTK